MPQPETGEGNEDALPQPSGKARKGYPRAGSPEPVKLSDILFEDTTFRFRSSPPTWELREDIKRHGHRKPVHLLGAGPPYRILDGFRRIAGARELGWGSVQAFVHRGIDDTQALRIAFQENLAQQDLSFPEKAHAILLARRAGLKTPEIAELFGLSEAEVLQYLKYLKSPDP